MNAALLIMVMELNKAIEIEFNTLWPDYALINHLVALRARLEAQMSDPTPSDAQTQFRLWKKSWEKPYNIPSRRRPVSDLSAEL